jgi:hypothetical protein
VIRTRHVTVCALTVVTIVGASNLARAQEQACDQWLLPPRESKGTKVGPESCRMLETTVTLGDLALNRIDIGLDGKVEGYLPKTGMYINYFTSSPDLVFPTGMNKGPIYHGVATYTRETGAAMTIVHPRERRAWNGKMWVTVHGRGRSFKRGTLRAWNKNLDPADPTRDLDKFDKLMIAKGYALAITHRTSETLGGDVQVTLEDGTLYPERNLNDNTQYIIDFAEVAGRALERRLGRAPRRTYFYGHSAGARIGRTLNYTPNLNRGRNGQPVFDGILADDSATGLWLPVVMRDGKDVSLMTDAEKAAFVPQLEVTHQMYNAESPGEKAAWVSTNYLRNKRENAKILRDKGLSPKHRMYEVRSISHNGGEGLDERRARGDVEILDLSRMMDRFIDMLDAWVDKGIQPPPTRSDWAELGDANSDGEIENPALAFPEVACPLGIYRQYPPSARSAGVGSTFFAAFTGEGLEPLDGRGVFVDMNGNGVWDFRETPTEAWRRLGLLAANETLTREKYAACVQAAAERLRKEGFFSDRTAQLYRGAGADLPAFAREARASARPRRSLGGGGKVGPYE